MNALLPFAVDFNPAPAPGSAAFRVPLPWLDGRTSECLFPDTLPVGEAHGFQLRTAGDLLLGCATLPVGDAPAAAARELYVRLLAASAGHSLYRIWNYVPGINETRHGVENYHAFCLGRAQAFEAGCGENFRASLPAASAVGCSGAALAVVFVAGRALPRHVENPAQVPAYAYPPEYGERPPSFARATVATHDGRPLVFISGTAAIKGHASVSPHSLHGQLDCTLDNLRLIGRAAGLGDALGANSALTRHFKIYLRDATAIDAVRARLERELLQPADHVIYLQADICRAALKLEIEATLLG